MNFFVRMERYLKILLVLALCFGLMPALFAQEPLTPEEKEKKFYEFIEKEVERYESTLKLESWQVFYVDSILTHDYRAMQEEFEALQARKVENNALYEGARDKWMQRIYDSFHRVLDDSQWAKYLKSGAGREQKAREKRAARQAAIKQK
jgi:hypothetical protein